MKKTFLILICVISLFFLSACGSSNSSSDDTDEDAEIVVNENEDISEEEEDGSITLDLNIGTYTGIYEGDTDIDGLPDGYGSFVVDFEDGSTYTYTGNWESGHMNGYGAEEWSNGNSCDGEYKNDMLNGTGTMTKSDGTIYEGDFVDGAIEGNGILTYSDGRVYSGEFAGGKASGYCTLTFPDGTYFEGKFTDLQNGTGLYYDLDGYCYDATIERGTLSYEIFTRDFFSDDEKLSRFRELYQSYQFEELYDYLNEYINENDVAPNDSVYVALGILEPLLEYQNVWRVEYDEFDSSYSVVFDGATDISSSTSIVASVSKGKLGVQVGFSKSGWLFFNKYSLSIDGNVEQNWTVKSYNTTREVLSGSTIMEYCSMNIYSYTLESFEKIKDAETVVIRFENTDSQETYDHTLTNAERDALYYGMLLEEAYSELQSLSSSVSSSRSDNVSFSIEEKNSLISMNYFSESPEEISDAIHFSYINTEDMDAEALEIFCDEENVYLCFSFDGLYNEISDDLENGKVANWDSLASSYANLGDVMIDNFLAFQNGTFDIYVCILSDLDTSVPMLVTKNGEIEYDFSVDDELIIEIWDSAEDNNSSDDPTDEG